MATQDTAGGAESPPRADDEVLVGFEHGDVEDPDGGGPMDIFKKGSGDKQDYLEVKLENVQITSYQLGGNPSDPPPGEPGIPGDLTGDTAESAAGYRDAFVADSFSFGVEREMKESGEKGGTEDINIGVGELQESPPDPGFVGGVRVATGDVNGDGAQYPPMVFTKRVDKVTPDDDDDEGFTIASLEPDAPGEVSGRMASASWTSAAAMAASCWRRRSEARRSRASRSTRSLQRGRVRTSPHRAAVAKSSRLTCSNTGSRRTWSSRISRR
jgi:hypothetical protein